MRLSSSQRFNWCPKALHSILVTERYHFRLKKVLSLSKTRLLASYKSSTFFIKEVISVLTNEISAPSIWTIVNNGHSCFGFGSTRFLDPLSNFSFRRRKFLFVFFFHSGLLDCGLLDLIKFFYFRHKELVLSFLWRFLHLTVIFGGAIIN